VIAPQHSTSLESAVGQPRGTGLACRRYLKGRCTVLALSGEIDEGSAAKFREELEAAIDQDRDKVVVDLTDVAFMDCSGIGQLVQALRRTAWTPGSICLTGPTGPVRRVLELTHVGTVCPIFETLENAVAPRTAG
jgi:anti-anti-sigma factor